MLRDYSNLVDDVEPIKRFRFGLQYLLIIIRVRETEPCRNKIIINDVYIVDGVTCWFVGVLKISGVR